MKPSLKDNMVNGVVGGLRCKVPGNRARLTPSDEDHYNAAHWAINSKGLNT